MAIGVAVGAWLRPLPKYQPPAPPTYSSQQVADAKAKVCAAYELVRAALAAAGVRDGGNDPTASLAVATSSRQALDVGGRYLSLKLAEEPATPLELASAVRQLGGIYQELTINYLADVSDSKVAELRRSAERPTATIDGQCR